MPSEQFFNLSPEKQTEIFDCCLEEFALHGFDVASTNRIVERAGISKGVLFKYFESKESLFLYVCESALKHMVELLPIASVAQFDDLFSFLKCIAMRKVTIYKQHPLMYRLFLRITRNPEHPVYSKVAGAATVIFNEYMSDVVRMLSPDKLKPGLSWGQTLTAVLWILEGIQNKYIKLVPEATDDDQFDTLCQQLLLEMDEYFVLLKYGMYSEDKDS